MTTFSVSRIKRYQNCPRSYYWYYVEKLPDHSFARDDMDAGTLVHAALESGLRAWHSTGDRLHGLQTAQVYLGAQDVSNYSVTAQGMAQHMVFAYVPRIFNTNIARVLSMPDGSPAVELKLNFRTGNDVGFTGYVDAVVETTAGNTLMIDWKTRGSLYDEDTVNIDSQLYLYLHGLQKQYDITADEAAQVQLKSKRGVEMRVTKVDSAATDVAVAALAAWAKAIERDAFMVPRFDSWTCKSCAYKERCLTFMRTGE